MIDIIIMISRRAKIAVNMLINKLWKNLQNPLQIRILRDHGMWMTISGAAFYQNLQFLGYSVKQL
jgi:hypothetical protein